MGSVPLKIVWNFVIDDEYPARIDKNKKKQVLGQSYTLFEFADCIIYQLI